MIVLIILSALLLVLVVLAQNSKGGGLSGSFGGSGASQVMGVKKTNDLLENITWGLAIAMLVLSLTSSMFLPTNSDGVGASSVNQEAAQDKSVTPPPGFQQDGTTTDPGTIDGGTTGEDDGLGGN